MSVCQVFLGSFVYQGSWSFGCTDASMSHTHTYTLTHSLSLSLSHTHTHTLTYTLSHTHTHTHTHTHLHTGHQLSVASSPQGRAFMLHFHQSSKPRPLIHHFGHTSAHCANTHTHTHTHSTHTHTVCTHTHTHRLHFASKATNLLIFFHRTQSEL